MRDPELLRWLQAMEQRLRADMQCIALRETKREFERVHDEIRNLRRVVSEVEDQLEILDEAVFDDDLASPVPADAPN